MTRNSSPTRGLARVPYAKLAELVRAITQLGVFASPFSYAARLRLALTPCAGTPGGAELIGQHELRWDADMSHAAQRAAVGREVCRHILRLFDRETDQAVRGLYAVTFPYDALPDFSAPQTRLLRLIHSQPTPQPVDASPAEPSRRRSARASRPR